MTKEVIDLLSSSEDDEEDCDDNEKEILSIIRGQISECAAASASASYSDEDDESEESDESHDVNLRSLEFLRNHCWVCDLWIHHPGLEDNDDDETKDTICYSALHLHPVLNVPVCVICAENIESIEREIRPGRIVSNNRQDKQIKNGKRDEDERDDGPTACNTCGKFNDGEEEYLQCDVCPRKVCWDCFEQAHHGNLPSSRGGKCFCCSCLEEGGGDNSNDETNNHKTKSEDRSDRNLPKFLQKLRRLTQKLFSSSSKTSNGNANQSIEDALDELYALEMEKQKCESKLEDPKYLLQDIHDELLEEDGKGAEDLDVFEVWKQQRYEERYEEWVQHQTRLLDRISIHSDRIKSEHGVEATAALRYMEANMTDEGDDHPNNTETDDNSNDIEPSWKIAADKELKKREKEERAKRRKEEKRLASLNSNSGCVDRRYLVEITADAEDLGSSDDATNGGDDSDNDDDSDDDEPDAYDNGWRNAPFKAKKQEIEIAREAEDARRIEEGKMKLVFRDKNHDKEEINEWDAGLKSSAMIVKKKSSKKRKRSVTTRTVSLPTGISPSAATKALSSRKRQKPGRERIRKLNFDSTKSGESLDDIDINVLVAKPKALQSSSFVLSKSPFICVPGAFDKHLKEHQKEGIRFMYENTFADLGGDEKADIGGCILAHSMGLGKSLSCVSLLYAVMAQPSLFDSEMGRGVIHKCLLVVPVNTLANWENEFEKWTKGLEKKEKLDIFNVSSAEKYGRHRMIEHWSRVGGILLTSVGLFRSMAGRKDIEKLLSGTDVIVLDESHTMLKNKESKAYKAFLGIKTPRRICLTGTPFQNNLLEYYRMVSYIRPNLLGDSEKRFQRDYMDPIQSGMASDAPDQDKISADERLTKFVNLLEPFIHRRDASLLCKDLPSLQQACLHVTPTTMQRAFYKAFREHQEVTNEKNFLKHYSALRTVHNHPATLLIEDRKPKDLVNKRRNSIDSSLAQEKTSELSSIKIEPAEITVPKKTSPNQEPPDVNDVIEILSSEDEEDDSDESYETNDKWWTKTAKKFGAEEMKSIERGNKCIVLLHILAHAMKLGEKTVVFSQSLKTLDFLLEVLASKNWQNLCPSLKKSFQGQSMGGWIQGKDFLRIDGGTSGIERGELLKDFYDDKSLKLFLISSVAGGIGINLVSASRVVLFDSHFNPTIDLQAIFRCYRYGQTRDVFTYRLLTQGTMEEKVYSRAVNKTSLGNRVIDGKKLHRCFEKGEIDSLSKVDDWVQCVKCQKWRMFPPDHKEDIANLPDIWYCKFMNKHDARMKLTCSSEERDSAWYYEHFKKPNQEITGNAHPESIASEVINKVSKVEKEKLVERDEVLKNLLTITSSSDNSTLIVSKHYFHDTLLTDNDPTNCNENDTENETARTPPVTKESKKRKLEL